MAKKPAQPEALQALKAAIREKKAERLYFFHGEETFLLHHYLEQLRKILIDPLTESFNFHKLTGETFSVQSFGDAVENLPMMAESTMVWVDEIDLFKLDEADREKMSEILSDIPDYCTAVFTYETTPWKPDKRLKKLWAAVEQFGNVIEFPRQEVRDLIPWIVRHFAANDKTISSELCSYLIDITGGTMTALGGEIAKLSAYCDTREIKKVDIDTVVEPVLDAVVFQMTDCMSQGEYGMALTKLQQLLKMQQEPLSILGAIGGHFRRLSTARILVDQGKPVSELMSLYHIGEYPAKKTMAAARKFSASFYQKAAELVLQTDYQIKTSFDEPERLLEMLVMTLAQEARNG